jgi:hypothetical protein
MRDHAAQAFISRMADYRIRTRRRGCAQPGHTSRKSEHHEMIFLIQRMKIRPAENESIYIPGK